MIQRHDIIIVAAAPEHNHRVNARLYRTCHMAWCTESNGADCVPARWGWHIHLRTSCCPLLPLLSPLPSPPHPTHGGRPGAPRSDQARPVGPVYALHAAHALAHIQSLQGLSERLANTLHAREGAMFRLN